MRRLWLALLPGLALVFSGCLSPSDVRIDADGDGVWISADGRGDCDDARADVYPGAAERCDGIDNSCDGTIDEDFPDADDDGTVDCLDLEVCDGIDNDGDGDIDEDSPDTDGDGTVDCIDPELCDGLDNDGDGAIDEDFADVNGNGVADCVDPAPCDQDTDGDGTPDCIDAEQCDGLDNDGDGTVDEGAGDADDDGTADCVDLETCDGLDNDGDRDIDEDFPDSDEDGTPDCRTLETCDGLDNDGDGAVDEGFDSDWQGGSDCVDDDLDGYSEEALDCDDTEPRVSPSFQFDITADGLDNDCDGTRDLGNDVGEAPWEAAGAPDASQAGATMLAADLDGDGLPERIVGAPGALLDLVPGTTNDDTGVDALDTGMDRTSSLAASLPGLVLISPGDSALDSSLGAAYKLTLNVTGDLLGAALATAPDTDGATAFLAAGAPGGAGGAGMVSVWPRAASLSELVGRKPARLSGAAAGDGFGTSLAFIGDLDGDGFPELAVGAPSATSPSYGVTGGVVYVYTGAKLTTGASLSIKDAMIILEGQAAGDRFGAALAGIDDLDGDGRMELLIGAPGSTVNDLASAGRAWLYFGIALLKHCEGPECALSIDGDTASGQTGSPLADLGDLDGDGLSELGIGSSPPTDTGASFLPRVSIFNGGAAAKLDPDGSGSMALGEAAATLTTGWDATQRHFALAGAPDLSGDGLGDLLIGVPSDPADVSYYDSGQVYLMTNEQVLGSADLGNAFGYFYSLEDGVRLGWSVHAAQLDAAGGIEMMFGAPGAEAIYLYSGLN